MRRRFLRYVLFITIKGRTVVIRVPFTTEVVTVFIPVAAWISCIIPFGSKRSRVTAVVYLYRFGRQVIAVISRLKSFNKTIPRQPRLCHRESSAQKEQNYAQNEYYNGKNGNYGE